MTDRSSGRGKKTGRARWSDTWGTKGARSRGRPGHMRGTRGPPKPWLFSGHGQAEAVARVEGPHERLAESAAGCDSPARPAPGGFRPLAYPRLAYQRALTAQPHQGQEKRHANKLKKAAS